jgi:lipid-A-disaccharide synthase
VSGPRLFVSAAEASGDVLAGDLVQVLRQRLPGLTVRGLAGPSMRAAGVEAIARSEDVSVMGVIEVLAKLRPILALRRRVRASLAEGADLLVVVDSPDFNIPLARTACELGIPVVFYVSPQVWAWRRKRAAEIAALAEEVLCLFPFEPAAYEAHGGRASFVGHPAAGRLSPQAPGTHYAVLPGSRRSEIARHRSVFRAAVAALQAAVPGAEVRLPVAPGLTAAELGEWPGVTLTSDVASALGGARAALVASGTATLEAACLGVPHVIAWRGHPLTYWIGQLLVRHVRWIGLPNLIAGRQVVPEFIQHLVPATLARAWQDAAVDPTQPPALAEVRQALAGGGAVDRAADRVIAALGR